MEELEYTIKQNKRTIQVQLNRILEPVAELQALIERDDFYGSDARTWADGHVAEEVAKMGALLERQRALMEALHMVKKAQE